MTIRLMMSYLRGRNETRLGSLNYLIWLAIETRADATNTEQIQSLRPRLDHAEGLLHFSVKVGTSHTA